MSTVGTSLSEFDDIRITHIITERITEPRNDGTRGSALYSIPFALSRVAPSDWAHLFIANWDNPPRFTSMHRPGIASVMDAMIVLNGTTIEEVEQYHRDTLQLAVAETNKQYRDLLCQHDQQRRIEEVQREQHRNSVADFAKRIKFD